jgi:hypothetical protein
MCGSYKPVSFLFVFIAKSVECQVYSQPFLDSAVFSLTESYCNELLGIPLEGKYTAWVSFENVVYTSCKNIFVIKIKKNKLI